MEETRESIHRLQALMTSMQLDLAKALIGNKSAAQRARVTSVIINKEFLRFRKISSESMGLGK